MRADTGSRRCTALLFLRRPVLPGLFLILRRLRRRFALVLRGRLLLLLDPVVELLQTTVRHRLRVSLLLLLVRPPGLGAAAFVRHDQPLLPSIDSCRPNAPSWRRTAAPQSRIRSRIIYALEDRHVPYPSG